MSDASVWQSNKNDGINETIDWSLDRISRTEVQENLAVLNDINIRCFKEFHEESTVIPLVYRAWL